MLRIISGSIVRKSRNEVYSVRVSYVWGTENIYTLIPYTRCNITNVPTAGASLWACSTGVLVISWKNNKRVTPKEISIDEGIITVVADENTVLEYDSSDYQKKFDEISEFRPDTNSVSTSIVVRAVTKNSTVGPNSNCRATVNWDGYCNISQYFMPTISIPFHVDSEFTYINNIP